MLSGDLLTVVLVECYISISFLYPVTDQGSSIQLRRGHSQKKMHSHFVILSSFCDSSPHTSLFLEQSRPIPVDALCSVDDANANGFVLKLKRQLFGHIQQFQLGCLGVSKLTHQPN